MQKANDFRDQSVPELEALLIEKRKEKFNLANKFQKEKKMDNPNALKDLKKDIARILTVLREKETQS